MQTQSQLDALVARVTTASLPGYRVARISSEPEIDPDGLEGLRVTIVLAGDPAGLSEDAALDILVDLRQALQEAGDDRFPFVDITSESELAADADPEPGPSH